MEFKLNTHVPEDSKWINMNPSAESHPALDGYRFVGEPIPLDQYVAPNEESVLEKAWNALKSLFKGGDKNTQASATKVSKPAIDNGRTPGDRWSTSWGCYDRPGGGTGCYKE